MPTLANDIASPSTFPRSRAGLASDSQAIPAVHETADESPCPTRTPKSPAKLETSASASVATDRSATPKIVSLRAPMRALQCPTIGEPSRTAPEYAPTARPACVFDMSRSRTYCGRSGTIANMSSASRKTTQ